MLNLYYSALFAAHPVIAQIRIFSTTYLHNGSPIDPGPLNFTIRIEQTAADLSRGNRYRTHKSGCSATPPKPAPALLLPPPPSRQKAE